ncbi:Innexin family-containing protein [Aphelenchoides fujianensis]|nr:Innexin family-containing protein [Aphelenchoides fujianensis]
MMIEAFISMLRFLSPRQDDDYADRCNYLYTPNLLLAFAVLISFKQFGGRPLEFKSAYAENLCWSESTYFVEPTVHVATLADEARYTPERKLSYYQWVPFALLLQAACFRFPSILWRLFSINSGLRIHEIVTRALDPANMEEATRQRNIEILSKHIAHALSFQKRRSRRNAFIYRPFKFLNTYLTSFVSMAYLVTKLLYAFNVVVQLYLLNKFLQTDRAGYQFFGYGVVKDLLSGIEWERSGFFPRVSICDFTVRQVANIQKYSVQCVLVIFILLWFWYLLLFVVTMLSLVYWLFVLICPCFGRWYISTNLELHESEAVDIRSKQDRKSVNKFVHEYLKQDGVFVLRMVTLHAGILFGTELVMHLYKIFAGIHEQKHAPPKTKPNHYVTNKEEYLRRRKHKKNTTLDPDEIVTTLLPEVISKRSSSSSSSSSSDSDRRSKSDQSDDLKKSKSDKSIV